MTVHCLRQLAINEIVKGCWKHEASLKALRLRAVAQAEQFCSAAPHAQAASTRRFACVIQRAAQRAGHLC